MKNVKETCNSSFVMSTTNKVFHHLLPFVYTVFDDDDERRRWQQQPNLFHMYYTGMESINNRFDEFTSTAALRLCTAVLYSLPTSLHTSKPKHLSILGN